MDDELLSLSEYEKEYHSNVNNNIFIYEHNTTYIENYDKICLDQLNNIDTNDDDIDVGAEISRIMKNYNFNYENNPVVRDNNMVEFVDNLEKRNK
jgi:hypothetical protein